VKALRKYVVMYLAFAFGPNGTTVASSPSPYPNCPVPLNHAASLNPTARQAVPWSLPFAKYFQTEFFAINVVVPGFDTGLTVTETAPDTVDAPRLSYARAVSEYVPAATPVHAKL
jgi:hypothetical protein